jgi:hypothetical protein
MEILEQKFRMSILDDCGAMGAVLLAGSEVMKLYQKGIKLVW